MDTSEPNPPPALPTPAEALAAGHATLPLPEPEKPEIVALTPPAVDLPTLPQAPYSHASAPGAALQPLELVRENLALQASRLDQLARAQETEWKQAQAVMQEMQATAELAQEMIGRLDEYMARMEAATAALVRLHQRQAQAAQS